MDYTEQQTIEDTTDIELESLEMMTSNNRQVALLSAAKAAHSSHGTQAILDRASEFYSWLEEDEQESRLLRSIQHYLEDMKVKHRCIDVHTVADTVLGLIRDYDA